MKTIRPFGTRSLILATALGVSVGIGFASPAFAQTFREAPVIVNPDGKMTILGTLGGSNSDARGINDSGRVVGVSRTAGGYQHAFITGPDGMGMTDLGTLGGPISAAYGINNSGQVVGESLLANGFGRAFITGPNGVGMTDLGTLGGSYSYARGINDSGQVVGYSQTADLSWRAFITGPDGMGMRDLGTLGESIRYANSSYANGINDSGQVAGNFDKTGYDDNGYEYIYGRAFITGPNGMGMTDLGALGGIVSEASAINDSGQVAGWSNVDGYMRAFITGPDGMEMTDLGTLGGPFSEARGINDSGQVVGWSRTADGDDHAFITGPDGVGMTDLNSIVDLPSWSYLSNAQGINNQGQVIATVAIIPEPASYALMLAGLGLVGFMARSKKEAA